MSNKNTVERNVAFFNAVRAAALADDSLTWANRIPEASVENFEKIGIVMLDPSGGQLMNEWLNSMLNRIGLTLFRAPRTRNKLARFFSGSMEWGEFIQETAVNIPKAKTYLGGKTIADLEPCEPNPYCKEITESVTHYHARNRKEFYKRTIWPNQLKPAFTGDGGFNTLIDIIISSLYDANAADTYIWTKRVFHEYITQSVVPLKAAQVVQIAPVTDDVTARNFIRALKLAALRLGDNTQAYNPSGIVQYTDPADMVLFVKRDMLPTIQVDTLTGAFHEEYLTDALTGMIVLDDFGDPASPIVAALVDKDFFMIYQNMQEFTTLYNPEGLYWNYWLHIWETYAASFMKNAIFFTTAPLTTT